MNSLKKNDSLYLRPSMKMRLLKNTLIGMIVFVIYIGVTCCSSSALSPMKFQERTWRLCQQNQIKDLKLTNESGYACYRYCTKYKFLHQHVTRNCYTWATDVLDLSKKEDFNKLRDAGFILRIEGK